MKDQVKIFAPATIANVGPGFDIFGLALDGIGDTMTVSLIDENKIIIENGKGCDGIPTDPTQNVAGVAVLAMLRQLSSDQGMRISIEKNILPGSGLGSSASSAAGAVFALNQLLGEPFSRNELIPFAMEGEGAASFAPHADNVSPCLLGGFTVVRSYSPLDVIQVPVNLDLWFTVIHPLIEVKTADSKRMLKKEISMQQGIQQWGNVAGVITALVSGDMDLLSRSMQDPLIEPVRSMLIPGFYDAKKAALDCGAVACSISGSGPSIFSISASQEGAQKVSDAFRKVYEQNQIDHNLYISKLNNIGTQVLS